MDSNEKGSLFDFVNNRKRFCELTADEQIKEAAKLEDMYRFLLLYLKKDQLHVIGREPQKLLKPIEANMIQWPENIFLKLLRMPYRALRTLAVKTKLYDRIVQSKPYQRLAESGIFFALGR